MARTQADKEPAAAPDVNNGEDQGWGRLYCLGTGHQVLEGEMSSGGCLFSLARLEAASNPHSAALKAASCTNSPVAVRSPPFCSGGSMSSLPGGLSRELAFIWG